MRKFFINRVILALTVVIVLAAVVTAAVALATDSNPFLEIFRPHKGDPNIVLVVNGELIRGEVIRQASQLGLLYGTVTPPDFEVRQLAPDEAKLIAVRAVLRSAAAYTEAKYRGIQVSIEEAQRITDYQRSLVEKAKTDPELSKTSQETLKAFKAMVKASGLSEEEWWKQQLEKTRQVTYETKLRHQVLGQLPSDATNMQPMEYWERFVDGLVAKAKIEVRDKTLKPLVDQALAKVRD